MEKQLRRMKPPGCMESPENFHTASADVRTQCKAAVQRQHMYKAANVELTSDSEVRADDSVEERQAVSPGQSLLSPGVFQQCIGHRSESFLQRAHRSPRLVKSEDIRQEITELFDK